MPFDSEPAAEVTARDRMIRLRDVISVMPSHNFDMSAWHCGTATCIGGTAEMLFFGNIDPSRDEDEVGALLGLNERASCDLFYPHQYARGAWKNITPAQAVRVLDRLLATGVVDWSVAK